MAFIVKGVGKIFSFLLPKLPDTNNEGSRLDDLQVTDSAYGDSISIIYGTTRTGGNVIWATPLEEEKVVTTKKVGGKGGGGGGTQTTTSYKYYANFAISFGEAEGRDLIRMWGDGKLLFSTKIADRSDILEFEKDALIYRFYSGSEDQTPDPFIFTNTNGLTPAFRGQCYIVFERFPLADFGNRIPSITAEINFKSTFIPEITVFEPAALGVLDVSSDSYKTVYIDKLRDLMYIQTGDGENDPILIVQLSTLALVSKTVIDWTRLKNKDLATEDTLSTIITGIFSNYGIIGFDPITQILYARAEMTGTSRFLVALNPFSGYIDSGLANPFNRIQGRVDDEGPGNTAIVVGDTLVTYNRVSSTLRREVAIFNKYTFEKITTVYRLRSASRYILPAKLTERAFVFGFVRTSTIGVRVVEDGIITIEYDILPQHIDADATSFITESNANYYVIPHLPTSTVIFLIELDTSAYAFSLDIDGNIIWITAVDFIPTLSDEFDTFTTVHSPALTQIPILGNNLTYLNDLQNRSISINLITGETPGTRIIPSDANYSIFNTYIFEPTSGIIIGYDTVADKLSRLNLSRKTIAADDLSAIVSNVLERSGIFEYDVSQLTDQVDGYAISSETTAKEILEAFSELYFFDVVERDRNLVFQKRTGMSMHTIPEADIIEIDNQAVDEQIIQNIELPGELYLEYIDKNNDYQQNVARASRILIPSPTVQNSNTITLGFSVTLDPSKAKQAAEILLYNKWVERIKYKLRLSPKYLYLDPTDVFIVELFDGTAFKVRITEQDIGVDYSIQLKLTREELGINNYESSVEADGGHILVPELPAFGPSRLFLLDIPYIIDFDGYISDTAKVYWGGAPYSLPPGLNWPGAILYRSLSAEDWIQVGQEIDELIWGSTSNALGEPESVWRIDKTNTLTVTVLSNIHLFESISEIEMLNGGNLAALMKENGEVELLQFQNAVQINEHTIQLSILLRGRRGTEVFASSHRANETFVLLTGETLSSLNFTLDQLNRAINYRLTTTGELFEEAAAMVYTSTGRNLKPYAPVHYRLLRLANNNIRIFWVRRTRLGGQLRDGTGTVSIAETVEKYSIDILATDNSVIRTINDISDTQYDYSFLDIQNDGLQNESELTIMIYQISESVGRGFSHKQTVVIE